MIVLAIVCGAGVGLGLTLIVTGLRGQMSANGLRRRLRHISERFTLRVSLCVGASVVALLFTRWPIAGVLAGLFGFAGRSRPIAWCMTTTASTVN